MVSVESHEKYRSLFRLSFVGQSGSALAIIVRHPHSHPPTPGRTGKLQDFRGLVAPLQVFRQFGGRSSRSAIEPIWTAQRPPVSRGAGDCRTSSRTLAVPGRYTSSALAAARERSMMRPSTKGPRSVMRTTAMVGFQIGDADDGTERQSEVRSRHGVHVVDLAVRAAPIVIGSAVPARHSDFFKDRFRVCGNFDFLGLACGRGRRSYSRLLLRKRRRAGLRLSVFVAAPAQQRSPSILANRAQGAAPTHPPVGRVGLMHGVDGFQDFLR